MTHRRELSVAAAYAALLVTLLAIAPAFFEAANLRDLLVAAAPVLVAAVGMTLVILARHIDISIGSQFSLCGLIPGLAAQGGLPTPLVALLTLLIGSLLGAVHRELVVVLRASSIDVRVATLGI